MADYVAADGKSNALIKMERNAGDALVRAGILKTAPVVRIKPTPKTTWGMNFFHDRRPYITGHCATCNLKTAFAGQNPEAECRMWHCGIGEGVPAAVVAEYKVILSEYRPERVKKVVEEVVAKVRAANPNNF